MIELFGNVIFANTSEILDPSVIFVAISIYAWNSKVALSIGIMFVTFVRIINS